MTFLRREDFDNIVIEGVLGFVNRHCKNNKNFDKKQEVEAKIDLFFGRNPQISRSAAEIGLATKSKTEHTELIIRTTLEFAYDNYKVDMDAKQKEISSLRRELRVAQQKSRSVVTSVTKKENEARAKERIIVKKNLKLEKLNKENGSLKKQISLLKKEITKVTKDKEMIDENHQVKPIGSTKNKKKKNKDKKFSDKKSPEDKRVVMNGRGFDKDTSEIYVYDIPKKYGSSEVEAILKEFGKVHSYETKRLHKYQLIKAEIFLSQHWKAQIKRSYITVSIGEEILNLRFVFAIIKKAEVEETWKRTAMIKIPGYNGKLNDLDAIKEHLEFMNKAVPFIYGKNIIIQGELYFWAIFKTDDRVRQAERLSKDVWIGNGWEILSDSKGYKKMKENKKLLSTIPKKQENEKKEKNPVAKSQLRKEYESKKTDSSPKPTEEEVVTIVDKFRKGDLDVNAKEFIPLIDPERITIVIEPEKVVETIRKDCRSTANNDKVKAESSNTRNNIAKGNEVSYKEDSQKQISQQTVDEFNKTNATCEANLRKVTEVKADRKRVNFKDREDKVKLQAVIKKEKK